MKRLKLRTSNVCNSLLINYLDRDEDLYEGERIESLNNYLQKNLSKSNTHSQQEFLHNCLRIRIPVLVKVFQASCNGKTSCNYPEFCKIIRSINIYNKYTNDDVLKDLFDKFKNKNNEMVFQEFIEDISKAAAENDFFDLKDVPILYCLNNIENTFAKSPKNSK